MSTYENVKFGKSQGSLVVSSTAITFQTSEKALKVSWASIAKHQINPKSHAKALLKIMMQNNKPAKLFQMANRQDLESINQEIMSYIRVLPDSDRSRAPSVASTAASASGASGATSVTSAASSAVAVAGLYQSVTYRNMVGALHLKENQLKFEAKEDAKKAFSLGYSNINKQQMSPPKVAKFMLKLTKQDDKVITFQVNSRQELESLNDDIEKRRKQAKKTAGAETAGGGAANADKKGGNSMRIETEDGSSQYSQIIFKSATGTLTLSKDQMEFQSTTSAKKVSKVVRWSRVTKCQGNPPSHAKVLLKVMLTDDSPLLFQLMDRATLQQLKDDIAAKLKAKAESKGKAKGSTNNSSSLGLGDQLSALKGSSKKQQQDEDERTTVTVETKFTVANNNHNRKSTSIPIVYEGVKQGNDVGKLILSKQDISFQKDGATSAAAARYPWGDIFKHQCSPPKIPKAMMKLVLTNAEKPVTFQLASRKDLDQIKRDIAIRLQEFQDHHADADNNNKLEPIAEASTHEKRDSTTSTSSTTTTTGNGKANGNGSAKVGEKPRQAAAENGKSQSKVETDGAPPEPGNDDNATPDTDKTLAAPKPTNSDKPNGDNGGAGEVTKTITKPHVDSTISDLLALADDSPKAAAKPILDPTISDLLAVASIGSGSGSDTSGFLPHNDAISGLLAITNQPPKEVVKTTKSSAASTSSDNSVGISSIFDESFASLMSDAAFTVMDDDSDDDFSVVTHQSVAGQEPEKMTSLPQDYHDVTFRSMKGVATLSKENLLFQPDETLHPGESPTKIAWESVERHHGSPPKKPKAMLKVFLNNGKSVTFTMVNRKDLELIRMDMTSRLHEYRKTSFTSKALEGLVIGKGTHSAARANGYVPSYKKLPPGAKSSSAYHPVHFQQAEGSLFLSWDQFSFQPSGLGDVDNAKTVFWDSVSGHEMSQEKPILIIKMADGTNLSFRFSNRRELEKCDKDTATRMSSYEEFESVSKTENGTYAPEPTKEKPLSPKSQKKKVKPVDDPDEFKVGPSLLDLSGSETSFDDFEDTDDLFARPPPPPPPPPPRHRSNSDGSNHSESSSSSNSSSSSSSSNNSQASDTQQGDATETGEDETESPETPGDEG